MLGRLPATLSFRGNSKLGCIICSRWQCENRWKLLCARIRTKLWNSFPLLKSLKAFCEWYFLSFRTAKDIQVLEYDEIHPKRTAFVAALGEGAFGKVHLATYKHGLEYFKDNQESSGQRRQQFVAVKELHGKPFLMFLLLCFVCLFIVVVVTVLFFSVALLLLFSIHFILSEDDWQ